MMRGIFLLITCAVFCPLFVKAEKFFIADGDVTGFIAAIHQANENNEADTIYLALRGRYLFTDPIPATHDGDSALPDVVLDQTLTNKIVIYGNGSALERDTNAPPFRIWMVFGGSLELHDVVIRNGKLDGFPGKNGAGIANYGALVVYNSTFVNNAASFLGGALYISIGSPTVLTSCTITGNQANAGSAIYFFSSSAAITHCTIVGNSCTGVTGTGLLNALIVDDSDTRVFIKNSIVALNTNSEGSQQDVGGVLISLGRNLIGTNNDPNTQVYLPVGMPNITQDYVGTSEAPVDPLINPLTDNGGLTPTMAIQPGSLAFNNGGIPTSAVPTDQAGNNRIGNAEIGSLELNNNPTISPAIEVRQGSTVIPDGSPFAVGEVVNGQPSGAIEFKIRNTGIFLKLNLIGTPKIILTGPNADDFSVDQSMTLGEIASNDETSFYITFTPSASGTRSAALSIASNDTGKAIYTIPLSGGNTGSHTPVITFTSPQTTGAIGEELILSATSASPAEIIFEITGGTGGGSFIAPALLRLESPGSIEVKASQGATTDYDAATAFQTITVLDMVTATGAREEKAVTVFPNPSGGAITLRDTRADKVSLVDLHGRVIMEWETGSTPFTIDIQNVSPGLYLLIGRHQMDVVFFERIVKK